MAIERRLTEIAGPVGGQAAHRPLAQRPGRHRPGDVHARGARCDAIAAIAGADGRAARRAPSEHADWPLPGYTHLQRAQPVYLGHHLLAYFWMLDARPRALRASPSAQAARAAARRRRAGGRELRHRPAAWSPSELGFAGVAPNSIDAVSNRDFVLDYLGAAATCATHLSRLGAELVLWSSAGVRLLRAARRVERRAPRSCRRRRTPTPPSCCARRRRGSSGTWRRFHGVMHALPLTYNKDLQEDKEHLFDAVDTLELALAAARGHGRRRALRPRADGARRPPTS